MNPSEINEGKKTWRQIVRPILMANTEEICVRSLMHCHARNVHSLVLARGPADKSLIRVFIAEPGHELGGNAPKIAETQQSVAFHPHHCELTLCPLFGDVRNWTLWYDAEGMTIPRYRYKSALREGEMKFQRCGQGLLKTVSFIPLDHAIHLEASEIHTMYAPSSEWAAWLVIEGREDPSYNSDFFSFTDPNNQDMTGFYQRMDLDHVARLMTELERRIEA